MANSFERWRAERHTGWSAKSPEEHYMRAHRNPDQSVVYLEENPSQAMDHRNAEDFYFTGQSEPAIDPVLHSHLDEEGHLQSEDLFGVKTHVFDIGFEASLADLTKAGQKKTWKISPAEYKDLLQVNKSTNRRNASGEELVGDIAKILLLGARVVEQKNSFPINIGFDMTGVVPSVITGSGRFVWTINADTPTQSVDYNIFNPDNFVNKESYKKLNTLTSDQLDKQIRFDLDESGATGAVSVGSIAHDKLLQLMDEGHYDGAGDLNDHLWDEVQSAEANRRARHVHIPEPIARELYNGLAQRVKQLESKYTDLRAFKADFSPVGLQTWDQESGLIGASTGVAADQRGFMNDFQLTKICSVRAKVEVAYVLNQ